MATCAAFSRLTAEALQVLPEKKINKYLHNIQKLCIPATAATLWLPQWLTRVQNGDREETSPGWFHERKRKKQGM